jgi:hypothetical protein
MGLCGRATWLGVFTALLVLAGAVPASATPSKPYTVVLTAGADASGLTVTAVITNPTTAQQQLGSANLTPPQGYTLSGGGSVVLSGGGNGTFSVVRNVVQLRNLNLAAGQFATATIDITSSPCASLSWGIIAKQANDFSGLPGNDLGPLTPGSNLVTSLCGAPCPKNSSCGSTDAGNPNGNAQVVTGKGKLAGQLVESANADNFVSLSCPDYASAADPNVYGVFSTVDRSKLVTITFRPSAQLSGTKQQILEAQQICFDAPYQFVTVPGTPLTSDGSGGFMGLLPDCPGNLNSATGPCHNRAADTTIPDAQSPIGFDIVLVAFVPAGLPGDPHFG